MPRFKGEVEQRWSMPVDIDADTLVEAEQEAHELLAAAIEDGMAPIGEDIDLEEE